MERPEDSRSQPSLDEIVSHSAAAIAEQIQEGGGAGRSRKWTFRSRWPRRSRILPGDAKITLEGHHNVTIATGRPDSVYGSVIVEYKEPKHAFAQQRRSPEQGGD